MWDGLNASRFENIDGDCLTEVSWSWRVLIGLVWILMWQKVIHFERNLMDLMAPHSKEIGLRDPEGLMETIVCCVRIM